MGDGAHRQPGRHAAEGAESRVKGKHIALQCLPLPKSTVNAECELLISGT